jgi:hypothetical protein
VLRAGVADGAAAGTEAALILGFTVFGCVACLGALDCLDVAADFVALAFGADFLAAFLAPFFADFGADFFAAGFFAAFFTFLAVDFFVFLATTFLARFFAAALALVTFAFFFFEGFFLVATTNSFVTQKRDYQD